MKFLKILTSLVFALSLNISLNAKEIKMGKADWDTGYFQAEVYKKALEKMGYKVTGPTVMKPQVFYVAAAAGDMDLWVNGWFGNYDKLTMTKLYIEHCHGLDLENCETDFIFSGDSPNDAPMFKYFSHSVGVANVRDFDGQLDSPPAYITEGRGGAGFTEIADFLTSVRN